MPVTCRSSPTHSEPSVNQLEEFAARAVTKCSEVGNQTDKPEHRRHCCVCRNRKHVPHQWTAKLRPDSHCVGIWKQPVHQPRPTQVKNWIHSGLCDRKESHCLSESVN